MKSVRVVRMSSESAFAGHYGSGFHLHEFRFGLAASLRTRNVTGFAHFPIEPARLTRPDIVLTDFSGASVTLARQTTTKLATRIGGGVDFNVGQHFAMRGIEAD